MSTRTQRLSVAIAIVVALLIALVFVAQLGDHQRPAAPAAAGRSAPPTRSGPDSPSDVRVALPRQEPGLAVERPRAATILFIDAQGAAVPGARLALVEDGVERALGVADQQSSLVLEAELIEGKDCLARAESFRATLVRMPAFVETATIVLTRGASISGSVRLADGTAPRESVQVVAWEEHCPPLCEDVSNPSNSARLHATTTDGAGNFSIGDLDPERRFSLTGAGRGCVIDGPVSGLAPGTDNVELTALSLYGIRLVFRDEQGEPLRTGRDVLAQQGGTIRLLDRTAKEASMFFNELVLAGLEGIGCNEAEVFKDSLILLYATAEEKESVGPVLVKTTQPGYEVVTQTVRAPRIAGRLTERTVCMKSDEAPTGDVLVKLKLPGPALATGGSIYLEGTKPGSRLALKIPSVSEDPYTIVGVPCDEYVARVGICERMARVSETEAGRPLMLSVLSGRTSVLEVDFTKKSCVNVALRDELGLSYEGVATFHVYSSRGTNFLITYEAAPYGLVGIVPGPAKISAVRGRSGAMHDDAQEFQGRLEVTGGGRHELLLDSRFQKRASVR